ncbi:acid-sensing ion channel 1C-like, partial [Rhincodon typus]|uniref:acid-sensing ion channel 1C-like n=1 Tax=Rhincodon typus TaxID=259920 RepID=UPI002030C689
MDLKGGSVYSSESVRPSNLESFASRSTLHGISHIFAYGPMSIRRILWILSFLGSFSLLSLVCVERVSYYFEYPHVTKLDEVSAGNLTFPAVTICNLNEFRFSQITQNDLYHVGEFLALLNERYEITKPTLAEPHILAALKKLANFRHFKPKPFNMSDFYNRTGHTIRDMLLMCTYRGENCTHHNFTT